MRPTPQLTAVFVLLILSCESSGRTPHVDTEETLWGFELERRKAYASDATTSMVGIATHARDAELCATSREGEIGPVPPISVNCNLAKDKKCSPVESPKEKWEYSHGLWDTAIWKRIDYKRTSPHRYHYSLSWRTLETGECENTATIFGDLDDDGVYSTYELIRYDELPDNDARPHLRVTNGLE